MPPNGDSVVRNNNKKSYSLTVPLVQGAFLDLHPFSLFLTSEAKFVLLEWSAASFYEKYFILNVNPSYYLANSTGRIFNFHIDIRSSIQIEGTCVMTGDLEWQEWWLKEVIVIFQVVYLFSFFYDIINAKKRKSIFKWKIYPKRG